MNSGVETQPGQHRQSLVLKKKKSKMSVTVDCGKLYMYIVLLRTTIKITIQSDIFQNTMKIWNSIKYSCNPNERKKRKIMQNRENRNK